MCAPRLLSREAVRNNLFIHQCLTMFIYAVHQHGPHVYKIREEAYIGYTPLRIMKGVQNRLDFMLLGFERWALEKPARVYTTCDTSSKATFVNMCAYVARSSHISF